MSFGCCACLPNRNELLFAHAALKRMEIRQNNSQVYAHQAQFVPFFFGVFLSSSVKSFVSSSSSRAICANERASHKPTE